MFINLYPRLTSLFLKVSYTVNMSDINIYGHRTVRTASFLVGNRHFDDVVLSESHGSLRYSEEFDPSKHGEALRDHLAKLSKSKRIELEKINVRRKALFAGTLLMASVTAGWRIVSGVDALSGIDDFSESATQMSLVATESLAAAAVLHELATRPKRRVLQEDLGDYSNIGAEIRRMQYEASPLYHRHSDEFYAPAATSDRSLFAECDDMGLESDGPGAIVLQFRPRNDDGHSA
jgi:hypothetical protein